MSQDASQPDSRRPAHDLAPLRGPHDRLSKVVDRHILGEEPIEDRAEEKRPGALEGLVFQDHGDLEPSGRRRPLRLPETPNDRPRAEAAHPADLAVGRAVGEIGEKGERLLERLRAVPCPVDETQMVEAQHVTRRQATSTVQAPPTLPSKAVKWGSRAGVGPAMQRTSSSTSSRKRKSAPLSPTGRCSARCRLVQRASTLSSATRRSSSGSERSPSERKT